MELIGRINDVATRLCHKACIGQEYPFNIISVINWHTRDDEDENLDTMVEVYSNVPVVLMDKKDFDTIGKTLKDFPDSINSLNLLDSFQAGYIKDKDAETGKLFVPRNKDFKDKNKFPLFIATDGKNMLMVHTGGGYTYPAFKGLISVEKELEIKKMIKALKKTA